MQNTHKKKTRNTQKQTEEAAEEEGNKPKQNLVTKTKQKCHEDQATACLSEAKQKHYKQNTRNQQQTQSM